jgi:hypothetical protein
LKNVPPPQPLLLLLHYILVHMKQERSASAVLNGNTYNYVWTS